MVNPELTANRETIDRAQAVSVRIDCGHISATGPFSPELRGTGVHIGDGRILTARHTINRFTKDSEITVTEVAGNHHPARIIYLAEKTDLAIVQIASSLALSARVESAKLQPHQILFVVGFRLLTRSLRVIYLGDTAELFPNDESLGDSFVADDSIEYPFGAVSHGFSGSGVFNAQGNLVGMVFAKSRREPRVIAAVTGRAIQAVLTLSGRFD